MQRLLCPLLLGYVNNREQRLQGHYLCSDLSAKEIWLENRISFHGTFDSSRFVFVVNEKVIFFVFSQIIHQRKKNKGIIKTCHSILFSFWEIYFTLVIRKYLVLICWRYLVFQKKKNKTRDQLLSDFFGDWFICPNEFFWFKTKPNFPKKTVLWKYLLIPTCFCCFWMLLRLYHSPSVQPASEPISLSLPKCVHIPCTCAHLYAQEPLLPSATYVNPSGDYHRLCAHMNESRSWLRICNQYIRLTEWFEMLGESCYINVSHYYL